MAAAVIHPRALSSRHENLELWRRCITGDDYTDPHDTVLRELAEYFKITVEEARHRCLHWEQNSLQEWQADDRSTTEGLRDFYQTQTSWIFDTMWYHANQYRGMAQPESILIAEGLHHLAPGRHLDFGAGPGTSSIFFHQLGWQVELADISTTFLEFAKWRLHRHGVPATFYNTSADVLPRESFDLITACDVMVHVGDIPKTIDTLYQTLKLGGYLVFNIDIRAKTPETESHLYPNRGFILKHVRKAGFRKHPNIQFFYVYQKVDQSVARRAVVATYDQARYSTPLVKVLDVTARLVNRFR